MPTPDIRIFKDLEELSHAAARDFARLAGEAPTSPKPFAAALSGGSTPKRLYELLATQEFSIPWSRVHLFQVDERCVPPDDPRSNYKMIREALLDRIALPAAHFHRMAAEQADRAAAAERYAAELREILGTPPAEWPRLDLVYLGMGEDGHTASLFPGSAALEEQELAVCANYVEKLKMYRLTLTFPVLNSAARVIFLVAGAQKAEVLRGVLQGRQAQFPAQRVQPSQGSVSWYVDEAAARYLEAGDSA